MKGWSFLKNLSNKTSTISSVSASILSLALTLMGFSNLSLTLWWHFLVAFLSVLFIYAIFYFSIETIIWFFEKYIKRASIKSDVRKELSDLKNFIDKIYDRDLKYDQSRVQCYKNILLIEIYELYGLAEQKINFIDINVQHHAIKDKFVLPNEEMYLNYKNFCDYIKEKYDIGKNGAS